MAIKRIVKEREPLQINQKKADQAVLINLQNLLATLEKRVEKLEKKTKV